MYFWDTMTARPHVIEVVTHRATRESDSEIADLVRVAMQKLQRAHDANNAGESGKVRGALGETKAALRAIADVIGSS